MAEDKYLYEIEAIETMADEDRILILVGTKEYLITKADFVKTLGGLNSDDYSKIAKLIIDGSGTGLLADDGNYKSIANLFNTSQVSINVNTGLAEIAGYHTHLNIDILNKFTVDVETGELLYDDNAIGGAYELPMATKDALGGVKVDGVTITIDENGVISGTSTYELPTASDTVLGGVKIDNDTIKINDGKISADVIGNWSAGVSYPVGYFVVYEETLYECTIANSDAVWTENNWLLIGGKNTGMSINNWTANTEYAAGNLIINGTTIYQCNTEHTSGETFDETNWIAMTGAKGDKGEDGFSPIVKVVATETGATITITDATETTTVDIANGTTPHIDETTKHWFIGEEDTGIVAEGVNGISPTATIEQTETGATVTVASGEETTTAELTNGITPHIDETTKNWFIGETNTGVLAEGTVEINADCAVLYATFTTDGWSDTTPYTQTVIINNITADNVPIVDISYSEDTILWDAERNAYNCLTKMETIDNGVIGYCLDSKPENDFTVKLRIAGDITGLTFVTQDEFNKLINTNYTGTLPATNWIGDAAPYTQTLNIEGLTANLHPILDLVVSEDIATGLSEIEEWGYISTAVASDNSLTIFCYETKPTLDLNVIVKVV